jgi:outer membrane protein OmpA-like peptidoglycan-associated protein
VSDKRAKAVYEALVKAGVSENQISYRGVGGHENLWDSRTLTRVVVIEPVK